MEQRFGQADNVTRLSWVVIILVFLYRLFLCATIATAESPDEWWQSTEVAYHMVFGKGHLPWEWHYGLRSVLFPGIIAFPFFLLKLVGLDTAWTVWFSSRLLQACVITAIDLCIFKLGDSMDAALEDAETEKLNSSSSSVVIFSVKGLRRRRNASIARTALLLSLTNWYMTFVGVRIYSNVIEALFVLLALQERSYVRFLLLSGVATAIRVTSGAVLFPLLFLHVYWQVREWGTFKGLARIVLWGAVMVAAVLGSVTLLDSFFYKRWIVTSLAFFRFNVLQNASRFFGEHAWYFYFFPSLPCLVGPHFLFTLSTPLVLWYDKESRAAARQLCGIIGLTLWTLGCYSLIDHKENRFIVTVLPFCFIVTAFVLSQLYHKSHAVRRLHRAFILLNIIVALLAGYVYRRGPLDVMAEVRSGPELERLDIIATCYTTPGFSYMHTKVKHLGLIDCSMHLDENTGLPALTEDIMFRRYSKDYVLWKYDGVHTFNKSDQKESSKAAELERTVEPKSAPLPEVMVMFHTFAKKMRGPFLHKHGYQLYRSFLHAPLAMAPYEDIYMDMWVRKVV
ncbi:GPI mannosyltransferase 3 [Trypanosoma grayi]|uniref:GPI mannosyltransferase 3 n=1 Tax=Trypanosoma grayi TaxID=71804 RepID=UPI0004F49FE1|nr:GPI mannosyltransferase 3 [Trypanosoma grayi]KEG14990.1 GPI mannosyltransferase 3 [Trypanosoma grayi]